jgi:hypothetical protein
LWLGVVLLLLPLVVSAGVLLVQVGSGFHPVSDNAQNELLTRDVGRHFLTLGPYARDGWNHLGPAMYYLLAVPYRLTGSNSVGMYVGALTINGIALAGITLIARRRGGLAGWLVTVLGLAFILHALGADFLRDPWNPSLTVLPFTLLVFLVWELAAGEAWALPVAAGVASFLVQTHIGYAPLALPLLLGGALWLAVVTLRKTRTGNARGTELQRVVRASVVAGLVLVVMWVPPVVAMIRNTPGNPRTAARYFLHPDTRHQTVHGLLDGYRAVAEQFSAAPEFVTGAHESSPLSGQPDYLSRTAVPWLLVPFAVAVWVLWRSRVRAAVQLAVIVAGTLALGVLAISRTVGPVYAYRLRWTWVLGVLALVVVVWAIWALASRASGAQQRWFLVFVAAGIGALTVTNTIAAAGTSMPQQPESARMNKLIAPLFKALPRREGVVVVNSGSFLGGQYGIGIVLGMERAGVPVRVADSPVAAQSLGAHRVYHGGAVRASLSLGDDASYDELARDPNQQLVSHVGTVSPEQRTELLSRIAAVQAQLRAGSVSSRVAGDRIIALLRRMPHYVGVFLRKP